MLRSASTLLDDSKISSYITHTSNKLNHFYESSQLNRWWSDPQAHRKEPATSCTSCSRGHRLSDDCYISYGRKCTTKLLLNMSMEFCCHVARCNYSSIHLRFFQVATHWPMLLDGQISDSELHVTGSPLKLVPVGTSMRHLYIIQEPGTRWKIVEGLWGRFCSFASSLFSPLCSQNCEAVT